MIVLLYILSAFTACLLGLFEALLFTNAKANPLFRDKFKIDIHKIFTIQRILIYLPTSYAAFLFGGYVDCLLYSFAVLTMFTFWHDGSYYVARKKLDGKYDGFFSQSEQTTARNSLKPYQRTLLFMLSIATLLFI